MGEDVKMLTEKSGQGLDVRVSSVPAFNFAFQQSALPIINEISVKNRSEQGTGALTCTLSADPAFFREMKVELGTLGPGEERLLEKVDLQLDYGMLSGLGEATHCTARLRITEGEREVAAKEIPLEVYSMDQWSGSQSLPELLCTFVTPNMSLIHQLQGRVAEELKEMTGSSSVEGYQSGRDRAYEICEAIYRALYKWGINYANPPASFGDPGQKIRFADSIYTYRLGTCLDTTLLFASIMEQCGLHPVIMLEKAHAYIGCHLEERTFAEMPVVDLQMIRKLVEVDEFLVLETTLVTGKSDFKGAEAYARENRLKDEDKFLYAVDVIRARMSGIRPLPLRKSVDGIEIERVEQEVEDLPSTPARQLRERVDLEALEKCEKERPADRVAHWSQKLLDLSLRNRLLNTRETKLFIPLAVPDIRTLEDKIVSEASLSVNALENLLSERDIRLQDENPGAGADPALLERELQGGRLWTPLTERDMVTRLTALYRESRTDLEEGGVNTLFLAVGFLSWKRSERDEKSYRAPLLLIPVEIRRKSLTKGFKIARRDEDTAINETLLELLRSEFKIEIPGVNPLPQDQAGVDVGRVLQIFRQAILSMKGWEVEERACLGHFSFGKFIMWNDLAARQEDLRKNALVNHLISGGGSFDDGIELFDPARIEEELDVKQLFCPMSADSSQLASVLYSARGKSFVLHGPPGTGKSQTITNMIAHNLALGRRVLFVSEKKAALDVVHRRLSSIGLRPFCLELHSNTAGKRAILDQFQEALDVPESPSPERSWEQLTDSILETRGVLDEYVKALHHRYPNGFSAYDCFSKLRYDRSAPVQEEYPVDCLAQGREEYDRTLEALNGICVAWTETSPEAVETYSLLDRTEWSPAYERDLVRRCSEWQEACGRVPGPARICGEALGINAGCSRARFTRLAAFAESLADAPDVPASLVDGNFGERRGKLEDFIGIARTFFGLRERLKGYQEERLAELDTAGIAARIRENSQAFFLVRFLKNRSLLGELAPIKRLGGGKLTLPELTALLPVVDEYLAARRAYEGGVGETRTLLGELWKDEDSDFERIGRVLEGFGKIFARWRELGDQRGTALDRLREILPLAGQELAEGGGVREKIDRFLAVWEPFTRADGVLAELAPKSAEVDSWEALSGRIERMVEAVADLRLVLHYRNVRSCADSLHVEALVDAMERGEIRHGDLVAHFERVYFSRFLEQVLEHSPALCNFSGATQNERISRFRELDRRYLRLSREVVFAKLAAQLPRRRFGKCPEGTELGILKRECEKKSRHKPVRQLLEQLPILTPVLKPCFLMSPLSVAQFLPPDTAPFDLVIFDEASQIPVWDAIGVIARGTQLVVVGDPKQMPPTNFFQKGNQEDDLPEEEGLVEDMESILDECLAAGVTSSYLNWHYRSRHESLIAFSNHYYYGDKLFTFPAASSSERLGVRLEFVPDGVYRRKSSRTNLPEAEALVAYIFREMENPESRGRSMGVVTFSQAQKDLIEDLVEKRLAESPELEAAFSDQGEEPFFVKNLENVQGDERDVILFSVCYAPDQDGKFFMNFGPLNRAGGERRLNVAITRAKEQVVVFASIRSEQIDLARTQATGATHLKRFLSYAEKGLQLNGSAREKEEGSALASVIGGFLADKGYRVEERVGSSGHRIDLAVVDPREPTRFLAGILCDGPSYAAQLTARDREHTRDSVLTRLGWHLYRAWSVDWILDRGRAETALLAFLKRVEEEPEAESPEATSPGVETKVVDTPSEKVSGAPGTPESPATGGEERADGAAAEPDLPEYPVYRVWESLPCDQEGFYEERNLAVIREQFLEALRIESPIYESLLKKRIYKAWGFSRAGEKILSILDRAFPADLTFTEWEGERVCWAPGIDPSEYRGYRLQGKGAARRTIDEIPPEELANAMYEVVADYAASDSEVLYRETLKRFGFQTMTVHARKYLDRAMVVVSRWLLVVGC